LAKPSQPATRRGEQTQQKLLSAAEQEFGERGFHNASISSITSRAGVAQGTFYIYFASKEDILKALVQHMSRKMRHSQTSAVEHIADRLTVEKAGLEHFLQFSIENQNLYKVVLESQFIDESIYREYYEKLVAVYANRLKQAQDDDQIHRADPETQAWILMGIGYFLGLRYSIWDGKMPPEQVLETAYDFIERGLSPNGPATASGR